MPRQLRRDGEREPDAHAAMTPRHHPIFLVAIPLTFAGAGLAQSKGDPPWLAAGIATLVAFAALAVAERAHLRAPERYRAPPPLWRAAIVWGALVLAMLELQRFAHLT
jgi:hypothetical protein